MNLALAPLLDAFPHRRIGVVGEAMLDSYLEGTTGRFCPEAPAPIVALSRRLDMPGGAANAAANLAGLGASVRMLSVIGEDAEAEVLRRCLVECGVSIDALLGRPLRRTLSKQRVLAASQILLRLDQGSTDPIDAGTEAILIDQLAKMFEECEAILLSDYHYGIITPRILRTLGELQLRHSRVLVADSRRLAAFADVGLTAVKPNYQEAVQLLGASVFEGAPVRADLILRHGERILDLTGARIAAVTLDQEGVVVVERGRPAYRVYARPHRYSCVAGAGDTFAAALTLALASGASAAVAAELASAAAAVVVGKERTAVCSAQELREYVSAENKYIPDRSRLASRLDFLKQQGKRIVFTNGCFDILHRGHITYLNRAKALGDVLIVGVNSDAGIQRLKGPTRPINRLDDRVQVLAALSCVDHLTSFDEETPCELIRVVRPNVFVKGGDYTRERLPEAPLVEEMGGVVHILPYLEDHSTTSIIERIQTSERSEEINR